MDIKRLASMVYKFFDKKTSGGAAKNENTSNKELVEESHKKKYTQFLQTIFGGTDLADMKLISKFNKVFRLLLCVVDIFSQYEWVIPLKDLKGITITNAFKKMLDESNRKPNKR